MRRLVLILVIALLSESLFSQKKDVKSGTITVIKKKYKVKRIYPVDIGRNFLARFTGRKLLVANLDGRYGFYPMSVAELLMQGKIYVNSDDFEVISFDLSYRVNGVEVVESSDGGQFSENQKKLAGYAKKGTKLYLENIICKNADGVIKNLGSITVKTPHGLVIGGGGSDHPDPFQIASVSGVYGLGPLRITKADLKSASKIDLSDPSAKIIGFSFYCKYNGVKLVEKSTSDQFTPKMKDILSKVRAGCDTVNLLQIRFSTEDGAIRNYGNLTYAVVK
jgi:hypothetical protein